MYVHLFEQRLLISSQIISGNFKDNAIKSVSDELLKAGKLLERITPTRRRCLMKFTECFELVTWLRESIKGKGWLYTTTETERSLLLNHF